MELSLTTPALLFPAISLLMLAYGNRFIALANLVRRLHNEYKEKKQDIKLVHQIRSLRRRINYIRYMQGLGVFSFLLCVVCMYCIYNNWFSVANYIFALSLISLSASLILSLIEIIQSTKAIELELSDIEDLGEKTYLHELWNKTTKPD
jgi:Protein of unknown function (DUF2721)